MLNNSTETLQESKDYLIRRKDDESIKDEDVIDAYNDFNSIVQRLDRTAFPGKHRLTLTTLSVTASGYALSGLTNLGSTDEGFRVYEDDEVKPQKMLEKVHPSAQGKGYYIEAGNLYLSKKESGTVTIEYTKKTDRTAIGTDLTTVTLAMDQDLEQAWHRYLMFTFYDGEYQFDMRADAEDRAIQELQRYYNRPPNMVNL